MIKLLQILKEAEKKKGPYIQKPKAREPEMPKELPGYQVTGREEDPITGTSTTYLSPEPRLLRFARAIAAMKKEMKHYNALPDNPNNKVIRSEVASILTSLNNAEGKLRNLNEKIKAFKNLEND